MELEVAKGSFDQVKSFDGGECWKYLVISNIDFFDMWARTEKSSLYQCLKSTWYKLTIRSTEALHSTWTAFAGKYPWQFVAHRNRCFGSSGTMRGQVLYRIKRICTMFQVWWYKWFMFQVRFSGSLSSKSARKKLMHENTWSLLQVFGRRSKTKQLMEVCTSWIWVPGKRHYREVKFRRKEFRESLLKRQTHAQSSTEQEITRHLAQPQ